MEGIDEEPIVVTFTRRPACGDMADSEGEFLGESFGDKKDLDRFKIPISGVSRGVKPTHPPTPSRALLSHSPSKTMAMKPRNAAGISPR